MKSSKHVETCFVRANNDFDDKLTFRMKNNFWTKIPKNGHCVWVEILSEKVFVISFIPVFHFALEKIVIESH